MNQTPVIDVNTINKVKLELKDQMEQSIFKEIYAKAEKLMHSILKNSEDVVCEGCKDEQTKDGPVKDEQITNVIAFLGARGRGKTSAMLSFLLSLDELQLQPDECGKLNNCIRMKVLKLPYIDAAILAEKEFVLDVILAQMWDRFEECIKNPMKGRNDISFNQLVKHIGEQFAVVRKAYLTLREKEEGSRSVQTDKDEPTAGALHELSASMNLRKELHALVRNYIRLLNYDVYASHFQRTDAGCLVIAIDDIDMSGKKAQLILEQVRRFLSIPGIVVLVTADIDRLKQMCESKYIDIYKSLDAMQSLHMFVNDYLEKVLPSNLRIYMPELNEIHSDIEIQKGMLENWNPQLKNKTEKGMILEIMSEKCHIQFDVSRNRRHFLQSTSLRTMANYFESISQLEDGDWYAWLKSDLKDRIIERIQNRGQLAFAGSLLTRDYERMNHIVISYICSEQGLDISSLSGKSLGSVLNMCSLFEEQDAGNIEFVNCILYLYSIILAQLHESADRQLENQDLLNKMIGGSLFGNWEYHLLSSSNVPVILSFDTKSELELSIKDISKEYKDNIENNAENKLAEYLEKVVCDNKEEILGWLYTMLFVEMDGQAIRSYNFTAKKNKTKSDKITNMFSFEDFMDEDEWDDEFLDSTDEDEAEDETLADYIEKKEEDEKEEQQPEEEEASELLSYIYVQLNGTVRKSFFGFMIKNQDQKEKLAKILEKMLEAVLNAIGQLLLEDDQVQKLLKDGQIQIFTDTIKKLSKNLLSDIDKEIENTKEFPVQNVEILYSIGKALEDGYININNNSDVVLDQMRNVYEIVKEELQKRDKDFNHRQICTSFAEEFCKNIQVKLFSKKEIMSDEVREKFIKYFNRIFTDQRKNSLF